MALIDVLKQKEKFLNTYWEKRDYFIDLRLKWRAQMVRHMFHLLPGESILELGCGKGQWSQAISEASLNENPICAATFDPEFHASLKSQNPPSNIEPVLLNDLPGALEGRKFDYIIGWHILPKENYGQFLSQIKKMIKPGGQFILFEPNPWNPYNWLKRTLVGLFGSLKSRVDRPVFNRIDMQSVLSEIGFVKIKIFPYDFLFPPIPKFMLWPMQNLSLILENAPYVRNFAGELYIWGQNPAPEGWERSRVQLTRHPVLNGKVSMVIPCHNEEPNIVPLVKNLTGYYNDYIHEIVLVDDNSKDRTAEVGEQLGQKDPRVRVVRRSMPNGVGRALRDGLSAATGDYVLLMDCDFQHILPELTGLFQAVAEGADVAIGSRFSRQSVLLNYAFTKILANRGFHFLARILFRKNFRDVTNNLKLMKNEVAKRLCLESHDFAANAETGLQPILLGYNVKEVPISWINRDLDMGFSSFRLAQTGPNYVTVFFRLISRQIRGKEVVLQPPKPKTTEHPS